jgi:hypothetical protein
MGHWTGIGRALDGLSRREVTGGPVQAGDPKTWKKQTVCSLVLDIYTAEWRKGDQCRAALPFGEVAMQQRRSRLLLWQAAIAAVNFAAAVIKAVATLSAHR